MERLKEILRPFYLKWLYFRLRPQAKPPHWDQCWRYPSPLETAPAPAPTRETPADILILPMVDWHARIQRPQQLARALAQLGHRCFFLNPNLGREFPQPVWLSRRLAVRQLEERIWEVHTGLVREPVFHHRLLSNRETGSVANALRLVAARFDVQRWTILCQFPLWTEAALRLRGEGHGPLCYDCHDLLSGFSNISPEIIAAERELFQQADLVVFSAKSLLERKLVELPAIGEKALLVRNGADTSHFQPTPGAKTRTVGYAGSLDTWFDVAALEQAAAQHPDCQFVLLGRIEDKRVLELGKLPNVRFYGEIPYDRLPGYLAEFDIAIIPFLISPLTQATNPIKLYEYFACGLPVVSTALPEVELYSDLAYIAHTPQEFADQIGVALGEDDPELRARRRKVAEGESWLARARQIQTAILTASVQSKAQE